MKKAKTRARPSTAAKGDVSAVDAYVAKVPEPTRTMLNKMRAAIRSAVPAEAVETISYRIPAFKHGRILVWFAAFTNHCSLFPTAAVVEAFKTELVGLATSKGTVQFAADKPLPIALIRRIVKARVAQARTGKRR